MVKLFGEPFVLKFDGGSSFNYSAVVIVVGVTGKPQNMEEECKFKSLIRFSFLIERQKNQNFCNKEGIFRDNRYNMVKELR